MNYPDVLNQRASWAGQGGLRRNDHHLHPCDSFRRRETNQSVWDPQNKDCRRLGYNFGLGK